MGARLEGDCLDCPLDLFVVAGHGQGRLPTSCAGRALPSRTLS